MCGYDINLAAHCCCDIVQSSLLDHLQRKEGQEAGEDQRQQPGPEGAFHLPEDEHSRQRPSGRQGQACSGEKCCALQRGFEVDFMNHTPAQVSEGPLSLSDTVQEFNQIDCDGITATVVVPISTVNLVFFTKLILKMI